MIRLATPLLAAFTLASCSVGPATATVDGAEVRMAAAPGLPSAGYFTLTLSRSSDALMHVSSPSAERIEMHESREREGVSSMVRLDSVPAVNGEPIRFAPGGKHLMIYGLNPQLRAGGQIELILTFAEAEPIRVPARLVAAGSAGAGPAMDMNQMGHAGH